MKAAYAANNRARGEGGRNLLAPPARRAPSATSTQSVAFFCRPTGQPGLRDEDTPLWTDAAGIFGEAVRVVEQAEREALAAGGVVLRYGFFAGPGTWYDAEGAVGELVRKRRYPVDRRGRRRLLLRPRRRRRGGDRRGPRRALGRLQRRRRPPRARPRTWLPGFAAALGAPAPRRVPALPVKLLGGRPLVDWQESLEGASNARARSLGWAPRHGSWRTAFRDP